jgi:pimeloyl-ACP methyl ester carboxylesterase
VFPAIRTLGIATAMCITSAWMTAAPPVARAQGYVAAIAYSQSTGKVGHTVRQARTEQQAKALALRNCGAPDAKVFMWAQNEWVAIAVADGVIGTAGFAHAHSDRQAQEQALRECQKHAKGGACRVALCVHSSGMRTGQLLMLARDPRLPPLPPKSEFVAAIAFSPSTGKIGHTAGAARTKEEAQQLALKSCGAPDAKTFMWGGEWVAIAVGDDRPGIAGFGPGATREIAERAAMEQCKKLTHGGPCHVALSVHSSGEAKTTSVAKPVTPGDAAATSAPERLRLRGEAQVVDGRPAFILLPEEANRAKPQPWVMYAPTLPGYPDEHERWMHEKFLAAGVAVAGIDVGEAYGSPKGRKGLTALYNELVKNRGFAAKPCLLGRSRGGLWAVSWAGENPDKVAGVAGIYPAFDLRTYPGLEKAAAAYELTAEQLASELPKQNPIEQAAGLAKARVPIFLIHGAKDDVVPLQANSAELAARYGAADAADLVDLKVIADQGHNFWPGFFQSQELVDFAVSRAKSGATR